MQPAPKPVFEPVDYIVVLKGTNKRVPTKKRKKKRNRSRRRNRDRDRDEEEEEEDSNLKNRTLHLSNQGTLNIYKISRFRRIKSDRRPSI